MLESRTNNLRLIKLVGLIILVVGIVSFAIAKSLNYARGPQINILQPQNGSSISSSTVKIVGQAFRINKITLNGDLIDIDELGNWEKRIIVFPGLNKITVRAEDQFGRKVEKQLDIVGQTNQY